ncbi:MAG: hypothetical protein QM768_01610 [Agriterribacter sp.]
MKQAAGILKNFAALISLLLFLTCTKSPQCEEWEVKDEKYFKGNVTNGCFADWSCTGSRTFTLTFCGESLRDARAGNTVILSKSQCCESTRTFIRFIRKV